MRFIDDYHTNIRYLQLFVVQAIVQRFYHCYKTHVVILIFNLLDGTIDDFVNHRLEKLPLEKRGTLVAEPILDYKKEKEPETLKELYTKIVAAKDSEIEALKEQIALHKQNSEEKTKLIEEKR